ncbi:SubName: Full=Uncharacterized protein {ECO:0000313/EMBL:CCA77439.1} [Serendipita indica DSM 11827]|nr:SubName: Full=Uncharacterized protein {ECO:0000313/EMBL:CCA77439.1} [Serendipita indica DSM 11827]
MRTLLHLKKKHRDSPFWNAWIFPSRDRDIAPSEHLETTVPSSSESTTDNVSHTRSAATCHTSVRPQISTTGPSRGANENSSLSGDHDKLNLSDSDTSPQITPISVTMTDTTGQTEIENDLQPGSQPIRQGSEATPAKQGQTTTQPHPYYKRHPPPDFNLRRDSIKLGRSVWDKNYSAVHEGILYRNGRDLKVAVKIPKSYGNSHGADGEPHRLMREFSGTLAVRHENVIEVYGICETLGDHGALVTPWYDENLRKYLRSERFAVERTDLLLGIVKGVVHMHSCGFAHGDLKPENVLISGDKAPKLCDLGLAEYYGGNPNLMNDELTNFARGVAAQLNTTTHLGSDRYIAPELICHRDIGAAPPKRTKESDVWAIGCLMLDVSPFYPLMHIKG